jgi:hypothetical protein
MITTNITNIEDAQLVRNLLKLQADLACANAQVTQLQSELLQSRSELLSVRSETILDIPAIQNELVAHIEANGRTFTQTHRTVRLLQYPHLQLLQVSGNVLVFGVGALRFGGPNLVRLQVTVGCGMIQRIALTWVSDSMDPSVRDALQIIEI